MTTSLTSNFKIQSSWNYVSTDELGIETKGAATKLYSQDLADGTGSEQASFVWRDRRTVTSATTTDDIDLSALTDEFGNAISALKIKELVIINLSTTLGQNLLVGGATSGAIQSLFNVGTSQLQVHAGGAIAASSPLSGYTLIPGSEDTLRITHNGAAGDIQYEIVVKGTN